MLAIGRLSVGNVMAYYSFMVFLSATWCFLATSPSVNGFKGIASQKSKSKN